MATKSADMNPAFSSQITGRQLSTASPVTETAAPSGTSAITSASAFAATRQRAPSPLVPTIVAGIPSGIGGETAPSSAATDSSLVDSSGIVWSPDSDASSARNASEM